MTADSEELVVFYVCFPGYLVRKVQANPADRCSMLDNLCPNKKYIFIHNGDALDRDRSFTSCGVKSAATIIGIPDSESQESLPSNVDRWKILTRSSDSFGEFVRQLMSQSTRGESLRIRDVKMMRMEAHAEKSRRAQNRWAANRDQVYVPTFQTSVVPPKAFQLPANPMPYLW
jgi:hypothetical protein